jgi:hypothetical protein
MDETVAQQHAIPLPIEKWEERVALLLTRLSNVQSAAIVLLTEKLRVLRESDLPGLAALQGRERDIISGLTECQQERQALLDLAREHGRPSRTIRELSHSLGGPSQDALQSQIKVAANQMRLINHHGLANWVVIQRSLIHLSQLLEIIATGGQLQPTYGKGEPCEAHGSLLDQAI